MRSGWYPILYMAAFLPFRAGPAPLVALLVAGCQWPSDPGRAITLPITTLDAPATVNAADGLIVRVTVQSGGCRVLQAVEARRAPGRVTLTARGHDSSGPRVNCTADIRTDVREIRVDPPLGDPFIVGARQPDGSETTRVIRVFQ